jgi:hypothetical protein
VWKTIGFFQKLPAIGLKAVRFFRMIELKLPLDNAENPL